MGFWDDKRVIVTGGGGFLGGAVVRAVRGRGVAEDRVFIARSREFDLRDRGECERMYGEAFGGEGADVVIHVAGTVGGIGATMARPGEFFHDNAAMGLHLIEGFRGAGLIERGAKFVMVGTAAAYPVGASVPLQEDSLWHGLPSEAGASYGVAKLMAMEMLGAYRRQYAMKSGYVVPINLYGPGDHFEEDRSHVAAALIRRFIEAAERGDSEVVCWGTGRATRDFLYVDDAAEGIVRTAEVMEDPRAINLGTGRETPIRELAETVAKAAGFAGEIRWDTEKPDGAPRRFLDISRAEELLGWRPAISLDEGVGRTVAWYRERGGV